MQGMLECAGSGRSAYRAARERHAVARDRRHGLPGAGAACASPTCSRPRASSRARRTSPARAATRAWSPTAAPVIRSIPMAKAMDENTLVAWAMNGEPLPWVHGYPLRLVVPGWVGSASTKWLHTLTVLDAPFKGTYMDSSYRVPRHPVEPGQKMPPDAVSAEAWPVKSMITSPAPNARVKAGDTVTVRGRAWVGEGAVERVEISIDEGKTWQRAHARAQRRAAQYAWRTLHLRASRRSARATSRFLARAWDDAGNAQPAVPAWNPLGYFWNGWHRVGVVVEA